ncbi:competence protein CoiA [Oenococcus sicerae]|uniref:competence protein CoiA n=1 Tax=Oenococcus sicerae TaxID=2203724 RepID=UPI0010BBFE2D|nr:hypothetical protein OAL24_00891 [Oenococcus sicerae]
MLIAQLIKNQTLVEADHAKRDELFSCPACQSIVTLRHGQIKIPYFAHLANANCQVFSENESQLHLKAKKELKAQAEAAGYTATLEKRLPDISQRADLVIENDLGQKMAIEYQQSPLSLQRLRERNAGYAKIALPVVWILGPNYVRAILKQRTVFKFSDAQNRLFYADASIEKIHLLTDFRKMDHTKLAMARTKLSLKNCLDYLLASRPNPCKSSYFKKPVRQKQMMINELHRLQQDAMCKRLPVEIVQLTYEQHKNLVCAPTIIHLGSQAGLSVTNWQWRLSLILRLIEVGEGHLTTIDRLLKQFSSETYFYPRMVKNAFAKNAFLKLLSEFEDANIISLKKAYVLVKHLPKWFSSYEQKLNSLR